MKRKILLFAVMGSFITLSHAQEGRGITGYAITSAEKGGRSWKEVRQINVQSGEQIKNIFNSSAGTVARNARTKKPVAGNAEQGATTITKVVQAPAAAKPGARIVNLDAELSTARGDRHVRVTKVVTVRKEEDKTRPFATNSAAMAYDNKHDRLYYTPMGINQLRYIDLRSGRVYFFEEEPFGTVSGFGDVKNQITRMVIASDGHGYALTNDAAHLLRFSTGKKASITDLGPVTQGNVAPNTPGIGRQYGGDMIADASGNLYLVTASRNVYKINIETRIAEHLGVIRGLPAGFSTNGAMVEGGSKVIVCSSESTLGYYRFDLNTLVAEKISQSGEVFNASDLANGILAFDKEKKKKDEVKEEETAANVEQSTRSATTAQAVGNGIAVYPNPVTDGRVRIAFNDLPAGLYQVQMADLGGKLIKSWSVSISGKSQVQDLQIPGVASGSYVLTIINAEGRSAGTKKLVVQ